MAKSRKTDEQSAQSPDQTPPAAEQSPLAENASDATAAPEQAPGGKLALAEAKLERMQETNKICFRFQNDLVKIEQELKDKFKYTDNELEHILAPKGQRMIPGFGYSEMERQKQYVSYLKQNTQQRTTHTDRVEQSRDERQGPSR